MSASGKQFPVELSTYAKGVAAALTRAGRLLDAGVYVQLWWDWAAGVPARSYAEFGQVFGVSEFVLAQVFKRLESDGVLRRSEVREGRRRYRVTLQILTPSPSGVTHSPLNDWGVVIGGLWGFPAQMSENAASDVSDCYVKLSEFGTTLALTTTTTATTGVVTAVKNNAVETPEIMSDTGADVACAESVAPAAPPTVSQNPPKKRTRAKKPKKIEEVRSSQEFRTLTMAEIQRDTHWGVIRDLHQAWCDGLGKQYALNTWRYAAWRFALVENGYTAEQLQGAIPGVRARDWWRDHCSDPHVMFAKNPSKIEQFFPVNRADRHDRFGVGAAAPTEGFEF